MALKFTQMTALAAPANEDLLAVCDDPAGTPATRKVSIGNLAPTVANVNVIGGLTQLFRITAAALTGDVDVVVTHKIRVLDVWTVQTAAGGAGDTIIVKNGSTAITDTLDNNKSDKVITRATTIDDAQHEIAAGGMLKVSGASGVTCEVYVLAIKVA